MRIYSFPQLSQERLNTLPPPAKGCSRSQFPLPRKTALSKSPESMQTAKSRKQEILASPPLTNLDIGRTATLLTKHTNRPARVGNTPGTPKEADPPEKELHSPKTAQVRFFGDTANSGRHETCATPKSGQSKILERSDRSSIRSLNQPQSLRRWSIDTGKNAMLRWEKSFAWSGFKLNANGRSQLILSVFVPTRNWRAIRERSLL